MPFPTNLTIFVHYLVVDYSDLCTKFVCAAFHFMTTALSFAGRQFFESSSPQFDDLTRLGRIQAFRGEATREEHDATMRRPFLVAVIHLLVISARSEYAENGGRRVRGLQREKTAAEEGSQYYGGYDVAVEGPGPPGQGPGADVPAPVQEEWSWSHPSEEEPPPVTAPSPEPIEVYGDGNGYGGTWTDSKGKGTSQKSAKSSSKSKKSKGSSKGKGSSSKSSKGMGEGKGQGIEPPKKHPKGSPSKSKKQMSKLSKSPGKGMGTGVMGSKSSKKPYPPHPPTPTPGGRPTGAPTPPPIAGECRSVYTTYVLARVPEAIAKTPARCCYFEGPTAAIVTHAEASAETESGFEIFWQEQYQVLDWSSSKAGVCFFMTGYDATLNTTRSLSEVLIDVNQVVSSISAVPAMMSTDPTPDLELIRELRSISENPGLPSLGVFNAGYSNIALETIMSGQKPLPYIGYLTEVSYGSSAAGATLELLDNITPQPLCLNARVDTVPLVGRRCAAYYTALNKKDTNPLTGVSCSAESTATQIYTLILSLDVNAVWAHGDCCAALGRAAEQARRIGRTLVAGCMDEETGGSSIDFVTKQAQVLQGYATSAWSNFPVIQQLRGNDGRGTQFFPSLSSLVNTAVYSEFENM